MPVHDARVQAHPLRDRVLAEFQRDPASPSDVARRLRLPLNLVSYHTRVLARHGYVELVRTELRRGAKTHYYRATEVSFVDDEGWLRLSVERRRDLVLSTLGRLAGEARDGAHDGAFDSPFAHLSRSPLELDPEGRRAVAAVLLRAYEHVARLGERTEGGARRTRVIAMLAFEARADVSPSDARSGPADP